MSTQGLPATIIVGVVKRKYDNSDVYFGGTCELEPTLFNLNAKHTAYECIACGYTLFLTDVLCVYYPDGSPGSRTEYYDNYILQHVEGFRAGSTGWYNNNDNSHSLIGRWSSSAYGEPHYVDIS